MNIKETKIFILVFWLLTLMLEVVYFQCHLQTARSLKEIGQVRVELVQEWFRTITYTFETLSRKTG